MNRARTLAVSFILFTFVTGVAQASWYDDYDAGLNAVKTGNWNAVVTKMSAAIKGNPKEANKAKTYGTIFINYHPYYYRGVAYLNLGKYDEAVADLERATGPGPENLGSIEMLMDSAKTKLRLAAASEPTQDPTPAPVRPTVTTPVPAPTPVPSLPAIDPALRQRASAALGTARQKLQAAQQRKATTSPQYAQAVTMVGDATAKNGSARNNDDLNAIIQLAENAGDLADLASAPAVAAATPAPALAVPAPTPKPVAATSAVLGDSTVRVRRALENYFAGEFDVAAREFERLTRDMPTNGWIWAFLGASQYSQYAFEAEESYRRAALDSFRKAKRLRSWKGGLPEKYFSRRIRKAFTDTSG